MPENSNGNQNGNRKTATVPCGECKTPITIEPPILHTVNGPTMSVIILPHDTPIACSGCGSVYTLKIGDGSNVNIDMVCLMKAEPKILMPGVSPAGPLKLM